MEGKLQSAQAEVVPPVGRAGDQGPQLTLQTVAGEIHHTEGAIPT